MSQTVVGDAIVARLTVKVEELALAMVMMERVANQLVEAVRELQAQAVGHTKFARVDDMTQVYNSDAMTDSMARESAARQDAEATSTIGD